MGFGFVGVARHDLDIHGDAAFFDFDDELEWHGCVVCLGLRESRGSKRIVNSKRVHAAAFAAAFRPAVNANFAAHPVDMQMGRRIVFAAPTPTRRTAVAAGVRIVRMVMKLEGADPAAVAVTGRIAVNAPVLRPRLEKTDSLERRCH